METISRVRVTGLVSRVEGRARVAVPLGDYDVSEIGIEDYELRRADYPTFILSAVEVGTYEHTGALRIIR
jgi:hypothetical protein